MRSEKQLLKKFQDAPFIIRMEIWSPDRNCLEVDGPCSQITGELFLKLFGFLNPDENEEAVMKIILSSFEEMRNEEAI